ncbi:MAG: hypothetical protein A2665_02210 [Candidatus Zambryskibacteria bacterium RIFCSPHIGHO2_01_FULL_46_30]|uniref:Uncharacterized protein n=1 Tax=Candidatus Zambryskibacteria bacterium RIFCSPHIGHO2_01_FULL_46_30 TaxID=1802739 RepID=A0A1G2T0X0_9BACT|nr:MAG: hypothetical protein A2665_02210 [Candidatus Zambryskibacteria bacterium RIFCSPHIGHO2_01_FULL_46_30]OHB05438.1 MAG: hypothetical protein A3B22_00425 [Candidatus Zambryskibacteria bacterium RIFCSPLOWO2_01_FULL_47_33]
MENEPVDNKSSSPYMLPLAIVVASIFIGGAVLYKDRLTPIQADSSSGETQKSARQISALEKAVLPETGVILPVTWGDLGSKLVSTGAIDADKFKTIYNQRGAFSNEYKNLLLGQNDGKLKITNENAGYLLNLFWALGLANKNPILELGEMASPAYGGAGKFASTGGWTIAQGSVMNHYSRHKFFDLTPEQQALVDKVSRGIYRPCCGNSTHFPDCNHGMAMLGFLELMASQGASEQDMWKAALAVNSYWFPDTYMTIAIYMKDRDVEWEDVSPQEVLGVNYSSAQGYAKIASQVTSPSSTQSRGGCGVDAGTPAPAPSLRQPGGCGI